MEIEIANILHLSLRKDTMLNMFIYIVWASMLSLYLVGIFNHLPVIGDHSNEAVTICFIIPALLAVPAFISKLYVIDYLFYLVCVLYYLSCYIFFPDNSAALTENAITSIFCVYTYYFIGRVIDIDKHFQVMVLVSTVCIFMDLFYYLIYAPQNKVMDDVAGYDNMFAAYQVLPHVTLLLWATLEKFRIWKLLTFILGALFLLSCGTRGPLVCLSFFGVVCFFCYMNFRGAIYVKTAIIATVLILIANLKFVIFHLVKAFTGLQLSTRILEKLIAGDLGNDSYRSILRDKLYSVMGESENFWGLGLFGTNKYDIIYPHFLPLDFICTFGYFIGIILFISLATLIGLAFWYSRGCKTQQFISFLFSITIIKLLISATFALDSFFYLLIGVCVSTLLSHQLSPQKNDCTE